MMKLYNVNTIVKQFGGCKEVRFAWFRCPGDHNRKPRPYAECILQLRSPRRVCAIRRGSRRRIVYLGRSKCTQRVFGSRAW
jgi:hypothetical protein